MVKIGKQLFKVTRERDSTIKLILQFVKNSYFAAHTTMEQNSTLLPADTAVPGYKPCISCGNPDVLKGYPNALCAECREKYIKYPIPLWVKAVGGGIVLTIVILLFSLPKNFSAAINYERAVKAEEAKNYVTEQQTLNGVVKAMPNYIEAKAHLLIAAFYNGDFQTVAIVASQISGKPFDDDALLSKTNRVMDMAETYFPSDSLSKFLKQYPDSAGPVPEDAYLQFLKQNPNDELGKFMYASYLDNQKRNVAADSILSGILDKDPDNLRVLCYEGGLKRVMNDAVASLRYYNHALEINNQCAGAFAGKARTALKQQQPKLGLEYALKSVAIDSADDYNQCTLIMAYHFNNKLHERDELMTRFNKNTSKASSLYFKYAVDVINNKDSL